MIDLVLLHSFVTVVGTGNFTRVVEHLHLTRSTVSQQILRFEQQLDYRLLGRSQRQVLPMKGGDRLLDCACRLLRLASEASEALSPEHTGGVLRLGAPEDLGSGAPMPLIASFTCERPRLRLEVRSDLSHRLLRLYRNGDLDMLFVEQWGTNSDCHARWAEPICWINSTERPHTLPLGPSQPSLPLVVFPVGTLYRQEMLHALESIGQPWRITYSSPSLASLCMTMSTGLGVSLLPISTVQAGHHVLGAADGFPEIGGLELTLFTRPDLDNTGHVLRDRLVEMCTVRAQTL